MWERLASVVLPVVLTVLLLGMVVLGIVKKVHVATTLFFATVLGNLALLLLMPDTLAAGSSGSALLDIFERIGASMVHSAGGYILTAMCMVAYVGYMERLNATQMLAALLVAPLQRLRSKYLIAALTIPIGVLMGIAIPGSLVTVTLLLGTVYPVLRTLGCSRPTCATAILLHTTIAISPSRAAYYNVLALLGREDSVPMWFVQIQLPTGAIMAAVEMVLFVLTSRYFDRREGLRGDTQEQLQGQTFRDVDAPVGYAALPLLPLVLVLVFSELVTGSVVISIVAACLLSWAAAFLVHLIRTRSLRLAAESFEAIYDNMGKIMTTSGIIVIFGTTFAEVITNLGGMRLLIEGVSRRTGGVGLLILVGALGLVMVCITGTFNGNLALVFPVVKEILAATGLAPLGAAQAVMYSLTCGAGVCLVSGQNLFLAQQTETDILVVIKRTAIPTLGAWAAGFAASLLLFG